MVCRTSRNEGARGRTTRPGPPSPAAALFKLINDWQAQGAVLPSELFKGLRAPPALAMASESASRKELQRDGRSDDGGRSHGQEKKTPNKPKGPPKVLPENPTSRHPVQLLNEIERVSWSTLLARRELLPRYSTESQ